MSELQSEQSELTSPVAGHRQARRPTAESTATARMLLLSATHNGTDGVFSPENDAIAASPPVVPLEPTPSATAAPNDTVAKSPGEPGGDDDEGDGDDGVDYSCVAAEPVESRTIPSSRTSRVRTADANVGDGTQLPPGVGSLPTSKQGARASVAPNSASGGLNASESNKDTDSPGKEEPEHEHAQGSPFRYFSERRIVEEKRRREAMADAKRKFLLDATAVSPLFMKKTNRLIVQQQQQKAVQQALAPLKKHDRPTVQQCRDAGTLGGPDKATKQSTVTSHKTSGTTSPLLLSTAGSGAKLVSPYTSPSKGGKHSSVGRGGKGGRGAVAGVISPPPRFTVFGDEDYGVDEVQTAEARSIAAAAEKGMLPDTALRDLPEHQRKVAINEERKKASAKLRVAQALQTEHHGQKNGTGGTAARAREVESMKSKGRHDGDPLDYVTEDSSAWKDYEMIAEHRNARQAVSSGGSSHRNGRIRGEKTSQSQNSAVTSPVRRTSGASSDWVDVSPDGRHPGHSVRSGTGRSSDLLAAVVHKEVERSPSRERQEMREREEKRRQAELRLPPIRSRLLEVGLQKTATRHAAAMKRDEGVARTKLQKLFRQLELIDQADDETIFALTGGPPRPSRKLQASRERHLAVVEHKRLRRKGQSPLSEASPLRSGW